MTNIEFVKLEDGKICAVMDEQIIDNCKYLFLVNAKDENDFTIRKQINDELIGLNDEEEFDNVIKSFAKIILGDSNEI